MRSTQAVLLFAVAALSAAYFYQGGGWNQNSRLDLTRALVDHHTLRIDAFHGNTGDKALRDGTYYSDKAPGTSWLAAPWYGAARLLLGDRLPGDRFLVLASYLATVGAVALPSGAAAVAVAWLSGWLGAGVAWQLGLGLAYALATLALPYGTLLYGHQPAAALLVCGFALIVGTRSPGRLFAAGLLLGTSVAVEYPALLAVGVLLVYAAVTVRARPPLLALALGLLPPLALLAAYHAAAFGSPLTLPYTFSTQTHRHAGFFMGLGVPDRHALWGILGSPYRGLFFSAPWLLLGAAGLAALVRRRHTRAEGLTCAAIVGLFVWLNASLVDWEGGSALGPRYLVPALPFLAVGAAGLLGSGRRIVDVVAAAAMAVSAVFMLVGTSVRPEVSKEIARPWSGVLWPQFVQGALADNRASFDDYLPGDTRRAWNLGMRMGLHGLASLLPLLALWGGAALLVVRARAAAPG